MPRQTSVNLLEATDTQVKELTEAGFGNFTTIVRTAIDRLYCQEIYHTLTRLEKIAWCAHHITVLRAVAQKVDHYPSPAILAELSATSHNLPKDDTCLFGYDSRYGMTDGISAQIEALKQELLSQPKHSVGDPDPAFEIVRHLKNRWYGKRENDAYPNKAADQILVRSPYPYFLP